MIYDTQIWYREDGIYKRLPFSGTIEEVGLQLYIMQESGAKNINIQSQPAIDSEKLSFIIKQHINQES